MVSREIFPNATSNEVAAPMGTANLGLGAGLGTGCVPSQYQQNLCPKMTKKKKKNSKDRKNLIYMKNLFQPIGCGHLH